jgi:hypothetical protein
MTNTPKFQDIKKTLTKSIFEALLRDCNPPPDRLEVPGWSVKPDEDAPGWGFAQASYILEGKTPKVHTVRFRYQYTPEGQFKLSTLQYV